jgi:uncharacterized protein (TIGR02145 family)
MYKNIHDKLALRPITSLVLARNQISITDKILKSAKDLKLHISDTFTDPRDGNIYKIVKIGDQVWMAENLRYIPHVSPPEEQGGIWVWGYHGHDIKEAIATDGYKKNGCFYDWETILKICPSGWHVPTDSEWKILGINLGMEYEDSDPTGWQGRNKFTQFEKISKWNGESIIKTDGMTTLPRGWRDSYGKFDSIGYSATWWSSPEIGAKGDWSHARLAGSNFSDIYDNSHGLAVRLIKD